MNPPATLSATDRFTLIVNALYQAVAARIAARTMSGDLITLICKRIRRFDTLLKALAAQIRAGTLRPGHTGPRRFAGRKEPPKSLLPRGFGWLLPLVPQYAATCAFQLRRLLADPEMAELIAATPRVAHALRPLCRMLGLPNNLLPPQPPRPRPQQIATGQVPTGQAPAVPAPTGQPPLPPEPAEAGPFPPPPPEPEPIARAGPTVFPWLWPVTDQH